MVRLSVLLGMGVAAACASGQGHVRARLTSEHAALVPGTTETLAIVLEIEEGWHVYWEGRNDSGYPVQVDLRVPEGFEAGPIRWPAPERHVSAGDILDHVYEGRAVLLIPVRVPVGAQGGEARFEADLNWLVCRQECVMEDAAVSLTVPLASAGAAPAMSRDAPLVEAYRKRVPRPLLAGDPVARRVRIGWEDGRVRMSVQGAAKVAFYPREGCVEWADLIREGEAKGGRLDLRPARGASGPVKGVLAFWEPTGEARWYDVDLEHGQGWGVPAAGGERNNG